MKAIQAPIGARRTGTLESKPTQSATTTCAMDAKPCPKCKSFGTSCAAGAPCEKGYDMNSPEGYGTYQCDWMQWRVSEEGEAWAEAENAKRNRYYRFIATFGEEIDRVTGADE